MAHGLVANLATISTLVLINSLIINPKLCKAGSFFSWGPSSSVGQGPVDIIASGLANRQLLQEAGIAGAQERPPAWYGRFDPIYKRTYMAPAISVNTCKSEGRNCAAIDGLSYPYEEYLMDPTSTEVPANPVLKVHYPKGSWSAGADFPGGTLFYAYPFKYHPTLDKGNVLSQVGAVLEYEVYFPEDFPFTKGGKLPGLSGGGDKNGRGCGGGASPDKNKCFSSRIMWRTDGHGESYIYVPEGKQTPDFCTEYQKCAGTKRIPCIECNYAAGVSWGRGTFQFKRGEWNKITMSVTLNTPNVTDGSLEIKHNDIVVIRNDKINWREYDNIFIEGVEVSTWFGGSDNTWAPAYDTHIMLRNFKAWRKDPPVARAVRNSVSAAELSKMQEMMREGQMIEEEEMSDVGA